MRPSIEGTLLKRVDFKFVPDFAGGTTQVFDAYIDVHPVAWLRFRAGKFKAPLGLERLQQDQDLPFMERALNQNLTSQRDVGVSVWGELWGGIVTYSVAILNGSPDGTLQDVDTNRAKDFAARLLIQPFKTEPVDRLGALGLHLGSSTGNRFGQPNAPQLPSFKSGGQNTFFTYLAPVVSADPDIAGAPVAHLRQSRLNPGLFYYIGPIGLLSDYVWSRQEVQKGSTTATLTNQAVHGTISVVVGGKNGYDGAVSVRPMAVNGGRDLARTLPSVDGRGDRFSGGGGGLTGCLPRGRKHGGHVEDAQAAAREARQEVGQVLHRVHPGQPAAAQDRVRDRGALTTRV
jgi:phosphate-selective porin OprO/OprP